MPDVDVQAIAMVALAIFALIYALYTKGIYNETKKQRLNASQPVIWPSISLSQTNARPGHKWSKLEVILVNIGNGPALEVVASPGVVLGEGHPQRISYLTAGGKEDLCFPLVFTDEEVPPVGEYEFLVEWRDLHKSGPYFQAKLPFSLQLVKRPELDYLDKLPTTLRSGF